MTIYVTCTDKFGTTMLGKISKMVYQCENLELANKLLNKLRFRSDLKNVNIAFNRPNYNGKNYDVSYRDYNGNKLKVYS